MQVGAQQLNLSLEGDSWSVARFDGLADGSYTLSVRAPGIAPYSQKIDVKGDSSAVELYVGDLAADPQAPARIGVLVPGDVNGDGITELPRAVLMAGYKDTSSSDAVYMLDWYAYGIGKVPTKVATTYQNISDAWSLLIDQKWHNRITAIKANDGGTQLCGIF